VDGNPLDVGLVAINHVAIGILPGGAD